VSLPGASYVEDTCAKNFRQKLTVLAVIRPTTCRIPHFRQSASRNSVSLTTPSVLPQYLSRSCRCLVPDTSYTVVKEFYGQVCFIACDACYSVSHSTFSPICLKDNSISLLLHPQFFFNIYNGRIAAWCQVCRRQLCKNFMKKLTELAVIRLTTCHIPHFRQFASRTTPFPFYYGHDK